MVEHIDVYNLPEGTVQLLQAFVDFLRQKRRTALVTPAESEDEPYWGGAALTSFAKDWDNPGDAIYDDWEERYHVREG